jgi:hypothetical protein
MIQGRNVREWRDVRDEVTRSPLILLSLPAFRAYPTRHDVSQRGDGIFDSFRHLSQDTGFVGQIDDVVF